MAGRLLLTGQEQAEQERSKRQQLAQQLGALAPEQLAGLGIDPSLLE